MDLTDYIPESGADKFDYPSKIEAFMRAMLSGADPFGGLRFPMNCKLVWSVGSSALTIALKTRDGSDPSADNPVMIPIRSATAADGDFTMMQLTAAASITIPNTALMGTANSVPFRLWAIGINDGGTFRLGVVNCVSTAAGAGAGRSLALIYPLAAHAIVSSTAVGTGADSAGVVYTDSAVASKPFATLGYGTWESGLATAGTWSAGPTVVQPFGPGVPLPGATLQAAVQQDGGGGSGTTQIPFDNTIPQITEGDQYIISGSFTPRSAANPLRHDVCWNGSISVNNNMTVALFRTGTANALAAVTEAPGPDCAANMRFTYWMLAESTAAQTFAVRAGIGAAGTTTFNGQAGSGVFNGTMASSLAVTEIQG